MFFELDPERVLDWLVDNGVIPMPALPDGGAPRPTCFAAAPQGEMLRLYRNDPDV